MINKETKKYIYDNLTNKDFTTISIIKELEETIKSDIKLKDYFNEFEIDTLSNNILTKDSLAEYDDFNNKITLYMECIKNHYMYLVKESIFKNDLLSKNIYMLSMIIHELIHIYQRVLCNELDKNIISFVNNSKMFYSTNTITYIKNTFMYRIYYDIFPVELHAEGYTTKFIYELIEYYEIHKKYIDYLDYSITPLIDNYKYKGSNVIPPMKRYYKLIHKLKEYNELDFNNYTSLERFLFGISTNNNEINNSINVLTRGMYDK